MEEENLEGVDPLVTRLGAEEQKLFRNLLGMVSRLFPGESVYHKIAEVKETFFFRSTLRVSKT